MTDFKKLIKTIVTPLVEHPEAITIDRVETDRFYEYRLTVAGDDVGRVIGKRGHVASAIRTIVYSVRINDSKRVRLVINDESKAPKWGVSASRGAFLYPINVGLKTTSMN